MPAETLRARQPAALQKHPTKNAHGCLALYPVAVDGDGRRLLGGGIARSWRDTAQPTTTCTGELIEAPATSGLARCAALHEKKETSARPGDSAVSGDFLPAVGVIYLPKCGGWRSHFYGTSGSVASCGAGSRSAANITDRCGSSAQPLSVHPVSLNCVDSVNTAG